MDSWALARSLLPEALSARLEKFPKAEEIRLRTGRPPSVICGGSERVIDRQTSDEQLLLRVMEKATGASLHAAAPSLRNGFINYRGIRIGVCGEAVFTGGTMSGLRSFSSLAIRVPHTLPSGCEELIEGLITPKPRNTLIVSPPGVGKTSFLRELIRQAASRGRRVAVIDERNELSASVSGNAQFDLGQGSDIMVGVPKTQAAIMLLRKSSAAVCAFLPPPTRGTPPISEKDRCTGRFCQAEFLKSLSPSAVRTGNASIQGKRCHDESDGLCPSSAFGADVPAPPAFSRKAKGGKRGVLP